MILSERYDYDRGLKGEISVFSLFTVTDLQFRLAKVPGSFWRPHRRERIQLSSA